VGERVVPGDGESQARPVVAMLDEVETRGVARGQVLRLHDDAVEEALGIPLGHERHADACQLVQLVARAAQRSLGAGGGQAGGGVLERGTQDPEGALRVGALRTRRVRSASAPSGRIRSGRPASAARRSASSSRATTATQSGAASSTLRSVSGAVPFVWSRRAHGASGAAASVSGAMLPKRLHSTASASSAPRIASMEYQSGWKTTARGRPIF